MSTILIYDFIQNDKGLISELFHKCTTSLISEHLLLISELFHKCATSLISEHLLPPSPLLRIYLVTTCVFQLGIEISISLSAFTFLLQTSKSLPKKTHLNLLKIVLTKYSQGMLFIALQQRCGDTS